MFSITVPFSGDMPDGTEIQLFYEFSDPGIPVSGPGGPLLGSGTGVIATTTVSGNQAVFTNISAPYAFESPAFCGFSQGMFIWHAGGDVQTVEAGYLIFNPANFPGPHTIPPAQIASIIPALPATFGPFVAKTMTATLGNGSVTLAGAGTVSTFLGSIPVSFTYSFSLSPAQCGSGMPVVVNTVSSDVRGNNGSLLGFLINPLIDAIIPFFEPNMQALMQSAVDGEMAQQLGSVPAGTTVTITNITIAPSAITLQAWASIPMASNCVGTMQGGSVKFRSSHQVVHLRQIRDRLLMRSPEGGGYASILKGNNTAIMTVLMKHQELFKHVDAFVEQVLKDFPQDALEAGKLSKTTAASLHDLMDRFIAVAPENLAITVRALKAQVDKFVGQSAADIMGQSWSLLGESQDL